MPVSEKCQDSYGYEAAPPNPRLEAMCRAHVSLISPDRKGRKVFKTLDQAWMQQLNLPWPTAAKERIYRYIHRRSLYQLRKHDTNLMDLAACIVTAAGLPTTSQVYENVADKCLSLLQPALSIWQSEGLIIRGGNDVLIKCPLFQTLWDVAMQQSSNRKLPIIPTAQFPEEGIDEARVNTAVVNKAPKKRSPGPTANLHGSKRPRNCEGDIEDYIVVSVPNTSKRPRKCQDDIEDFIVVSVPNSSDCDIQTGRRTKEGDETSPWKATLPSASIQSKQPEAQAEVDPHSAGSPVPDVSADLPVTSPKSNYESNIPQVETRPPPPASSIPGPATMKSSATEPNHGSSTAQIYAESHSPVSPLLAVSTSSPVNPTEPGLPSSLASSGSLLYPTDRWHPPPVTFTDSERVESDLPPEVLESLTMPFDRTARISIMPWPTRRHQDGPAQSRFFSIRAIMCCELGVFYKWYSQLYSNPNYLLLRFELIDLTHQKERGFIISENQPESFRMLKQYIWDTFWIESRLRGALGSFTITVEPYLPGSTTNFRNERQRPPPISPLAASQTQPVRSAKKPKPPPTLRVPKPLNKLAPPPLARISAQNIALRTIAGRYYREIQSK